MRNRRRGVREVYSAILERSCAERHRRFKSCPLRQTTALAQSRNRKEKPNCFSFSFSSILLRLRYAPECRYRPRDAPLCCAIPSRFALLTNPVLSAKLRRLFRAETEKRSQIASLFLFRQFCCACVTLRNAGTDRVTLRFATLFRRALRSLQILSSPP